MMVVVFPIAVVIYAFSGCDLRRRSAKHACRDGSAEQCFAVGQFYESRTDGLIATMLSNATTAKDYYDRACKLGNTPGCARFGHMIVVGSYDAMRGDDFTREDGLNALEKACDGGQTDACGELADHADAAQAAPVFAKRCDAGDKDSCNKLVHAYLRIDPKRAGELLAKLCDAGDNDHCRELGSAYLAGGTYVDADPARAVTLLTRACDHDVWDGCRELGEAYLDGKLPRDPARADELLGKAAEHGDADACFERGKALVASDPAKAVQTFTTECDRGDDRGCDALGDLSRVGTAGIARDRARASSYYDRACRHESDFDCHKRDCMRGDSDACYRVHEEQRDRRFRLGPPFDMK